MSIVRANSNNTFDILSGNMDIPNLDLLLEQLERRILEKENPVGHIRMETSNVNPKEYLGFGEWQLWGSGRVPVGIDISQTEFNSVEKTGGTKIHKHGLGLGFAEIDLSRRTSDIQMNWTSRGTKWNPNWSASVSFSDTPKRDNIADSVDLGGTTEDSSTVQPYITCYMWKRIS